MGLREGVAATKSVTVSGRAIAGAFGKEANRKSDDCHDSDEIVLQSALPSNPQEYGVRMLNYPPKKTKQTGILECYGGRRQEIEIGDRR